ncbi:MAG: hypothetical protein KAY59_10070 [Acidobacteria bacterium]|nr:hypothetical protein [Acidobacteriota bacterium]
MSALLIIDLLVCALSIGVRVPAIRHYLRNWRGRVRRNPESAALAMEIGMNCYGATMGALGAIATHEVRVPVVMTMGIQLGIGINMLVAIYTAKRLYEAQDERR